ncbi:MAG: hypothetical protein KGP28_08470 [Bdellovibrionales bacterium]|nr:hypothetical protein [Bdellovibrionales bacterium]
MENECVDCRKPKAGLECGLCFSTICKSCAQSPPHGSFRLLPAIPEQLSHSRYCGTCYSEQVEPELHTYEETLERAKQTLIFFKTQKKGLRISRKERLPEHVDACPDRDETILRLAYLAASKGYNAVIEVEVSAKKVRNEAYQSSIWSGSGVPAEVDSIEFD